MVDSLCGARVYEVAVREARQEAFRAVIEGYPYVPRACAMEAVSRAVVLRPAYLAFKAGLEGKGLEGDEIEAWWAGRDLRKCHVRTLYALEAFETAVATNALITLNPIDYLVDPGPSPL